VADRPRPPRGPLQQQHPRPPRGPLAADAHDEHDALLVVAYVGGDLEGDEAGVAAARIAACGSCADLAADIASIAAATAALPPASRPRDFSITPGQASRLHGRGWRGVLVTLTAPRSVLAPRLGAALTTLGVAGLLLASIPGISLGDGTVGTLSQPADRNALVEQASPAAGQGQFAPPDVQAEGPASSTDRSQGRVDTAGEPKSSDLGTGAPGTADRLPLILLSSAFLASGLGIFAIRRTARRPLDR
jgi:anti-sigma factor RsiW